MFAKLRLDILNIDNYRLNAHPNNKSQPQNLSDVVEL